jgi:hypothetical protein
LTEDRTDSDDEDSLAQAARYYDNIDLGMSPSSSRDRAGSSVCSSVLMSSSPSASSWRSEVRANLRNLEHKMQPIVAPVTTLHPRPNTPQDYRGIRVRCAQETDPVTQTIKLSKIRPGPKNKVEREVLLTDEITDGRVRLLGAKVHLGKEISGSVQLRHVWKEFPAFATPVRDNRGRTFYKETTAHNVEREVEIALALNNAFAPIACWESRYGYYVQLPVARAELSTVLRHAHRTVKEGAKPLKLLAFRLMHDLLPQLMTLHDKGLAHNDISADNVLMDETFHFHLSDFGSARRRDLPPLSGVWVHKRPEAFTGVASNPQADDLWALGKLLVKTLLGPSKDNDPFLPEFHYPTEDDARAILHQAEVPLDPYNIEVAEQLQKKWQGMAPKCNDWYRRNHQHRHAIARGLHGALPWPAPAEAILMDEDARRIDNIFYRLSKSDSSGIFLKMALMMFEPDPYKVRPARGILEWCGSFLAGVFPKKSSLDLMEEVSPEEGADPGSFGYEPRRLSQKQLDILADRRRNEDSLQALLSGAKGKAWKLCHQDTSPAEPDHYPGAIPIRRTPAAGAPFGRP